MPDSGNVSTYSNLAPEPDRVFAPAEAQTTQIAVKARFGS